MDTDREAMSREQLVAEVRKLRDIMTTTMADVVFS